MQGTTKTPRQFVVLHSPTLLVAQQEIEGQVRLAISLPQFLQQPTHSILLTFLKQRLNFQFPWTSKILELCTNP
jgi:hypothetical protein